MSRIKILDNIYKGTIKFEVMTMSINKFINYLWNKNITIINLTYINANTINLTIYISDYEKFLKAFEKIDGRYTIIARDSISYMFMKIKRRWSFILGSILFIFLIYIYSTHIWNIDIKTMKYLSPFEVRQLLKGENIDIGTRKKSIKYDIIEESLMEKNKNIAWISIETIGSKLKVEIAEKVIPPEFKSEEENNDIVATKDGEIIRIYTSAGTADVKPGDIVKKGQTLIKSIQGKEGSTYSVPAKGVVYAKTYYEESKKVNFKEVKQERTGNKVENIYFTIGDKKIYLKKSINNFDKYDRIENKGLNFTKETFYELKDVEIKLNEEEEIDKAETELVNMINLDLSKDMKVIDKIVEKNPMSNGCEIRVVIICEENISSK